MTHNGLIKILLESNSIVDFITELIEHSPENVEERTLTNLQANPETRNIIDGLDKKALDNLSDVLTDSEAQIKYQAFKTGLDFALILRGEEPIYNVLPESL